MMFSEERMVRACVSFSKILAAGGIFCLAFVLLGKTTDLPAAQAAAPPAAPASFCGTPDSPIRVEVFSDFQCPHCRTLYIDVIQPLIRDYGNSKRVYIIYHDFPLDMHPHGRAASRLALAAIHVSRDLWLRVVDALYVNQEQWSQDGKLDAILAKALKPEELAKIKTLAADSAVENELNREISLGNSRKITSTPTYFIIAQTGRQQRLDRPLGYSIVKNYIDGFLK
jgi:protein-disulfide isomerase